MIRLFVFGNGNTTFADFLLYYRVHLLRLADEPDTHFLLSDFKGVDTLAMEVLKTQTTQVSIYHIGEKPRYLPDHYKTKVSEWEIVGGFNTDKERDNAAIEACTHFLGIDFNSDTQRKSGTQKNIEKCLSLRKIDVQKS